MNRYARRNLYLPKASACRSAIPSVMAVLGRSLAVVVAAMVFASAARAQTTAGQDDPQFRQDVQALSAFESRVIGSEGYYKAAEYLEQQIRAIQKSTDQKIQQLQEQIRANPPDSPKTAAAIEALRQLPSIELQVHEFRVMVPHTDRADLTLPDKTVQKVYPFWPASVRVNSTPETGISGRLVYVKDATFDQLKPKDLAGQIAVVEASARDFWIQAKDFGARAIIVLGSDKDDPATGRKRTTNLDLRSHEISIPVNIPRFYIPDGKLADELRAGKYAQPATLFAKVSWRSEKAKNLYVLMRPALTAVIDKLPAGAQWVIGRTLNFGPTGWTLSSNPAAIVLSAPYDASSLVPDLAPGAGQAVQPAAALAILRDGADPAGRILVEPLEQWPQSLVIPEALKDRLRYDASQRALVLKGTISEAEAKLLPAAQPSTQPLEQWPQQAQVPESLKDKLTFDAASKVATLSVAMSGEERDTLLKGADDAFKQVIQKLYDESNARRAMQSLSQRSRPLSRPIMLALGGADSIQFLGTRQMLMAFANPPSKWRDELAGDLKQNIENVANDLARLRELKDQPTRLDPSKDRRLIDRIVKVIETDIAVWQDELFRIRVKATRTAQDKVNETRLQQWQENLNTLRYVIEQHPEQLAGKALPHHDKDQPETDLPIPLPPGVTSDGMLLPAARAYVQRTIVRMKLLSGDRENPEPQEKAEMAAAANYADYSQRQAELTRRTELYTWLAQRLRRDADPSDKTNNSRLIETLIAIDLSDCGRSVGPMNWGQFHRTASTALIQDWVDWLTKRSDECHKRIGAEWMTSIQHVLNTEPFGTALAVQTWLCASMPIGSEPAQVWGVPGFSMITLDDQRVLRDTPLDTWQNLRMDALLPQLAALRTTLWQACNDPSLKGQQETQWQENAVAGQVVSPAAGRPVPDLPREGFLVTYFYATAAKSPALKGQPYTMGVRRNEVVPCDAEGFYRFEGLSKLATANVNMDWIAVEVFQVAPDGSVVACSDLGKQSGAIKLVTDLKQSQDLIRSLVFKCQEFTLVGLFDPRFMQDLGEVSLLDQRRRADPQRFNYLLTKQMMAAFVEPEQRSLLIFRYGRVGNRLLLLNQELAVKLAELPKALEVPAELKRQVFYDTDKKTLGFRGIMSQSQRQKLLALSADGPWRDAIEKLFAHVPGQVEVFTRGFSPDELNNLGPISQVTAADFWILNAGRMNEYKKAGVENKLVSDLHQEAALSIATAAQAYEANDGEAMIRHTTGAWATEARVYLALQNLSSDVIHAAIFLLLLCIPFCFCMERLLIGAANIYKQIAYTGLFFAIMTAALASFHPAFRISSSPLIIILAFAIIFMSIVVIVVVYGKFDAELKKIRSGRGAASTSFVRASVLMSAVLLGIANMRKRKFRTALTSITIILITFAVLCFTSSSQKLDTTTLPTGLPSTYKGLQVRQRGFRQMQPSTLEMLRAVLRLPGDTQRQVVERWWNLDAGADNNKLNLLAVGPGADAAAAVADGAIPLADRTSPQQAVLGLSPGESSLSSIGDIIPNFDQLESGRKDIIYISKEAAEKLKVREGGQVRSLKQGDWVLIGGFTLRVAGLFPADEFYVRLHTLSGESLAPIKYSAGLNDASGRALTDNSADSLDMDAGDAAADMNKPYEHLSPTQFVIVPAAVSRALPNASLRSVAFKLADQKEVETVAKDLGKHFAVAMFAGYDDGVKMVAVSTGLPDVSGAGQVAIPLAIAGLIIFNTMMGSIAERRREIHVYTSLGLAPLHVGALFLAEAMTYGLIGTVFGYVVGQGIGALFLKLGWLGSVTLNYSGTSAMMTMGLILVIVLLSALVPARLASKIAAPSIERTWKIPMPSGDRITAMLPFTINRTAADGVLAYLAEYFDAHQEGSIGKFSAGRIEFVLYEDETGRTSRGLRTMIWLTPFDLGIRQRLMLLIHPGQFQDIYEVQVVLERMSGDDGSWYRLNRTFLTELRKQFLQWRSLTPQRMLEYVGESKRVLAETPERVRAVATEAVGVTGA